MTFSIRSQSNDEDMICGSNIYRINNRKLYDVPLPLLSSPTVIASFCITSLGMAATMNDDDDNADDDVSKNAHSLLYDNRTSNFKERKEARIQHAQ